jgi:hypothetical protein
LYDSCASEIGGKVNLLLLLLDNETKGWRERERDSDFPTLVHTDYERGMFMFTETEMRKMRKNQLIPAQAIFSYLRESERPTDL